MQTSANQNVNMIYPTPNSTTRQSLNGTAFQSSDNQTLNQSTQSSSSVFYQPVASNINHTHSNQSFQQRTSFRQQPAITIVPNLPNSSYRYHPYNMVPLPANNNIYVSEYNQNVRINTNNNILNASNVLNFIFEIYLNFN